MVVGLDIGTCCIRVAVGEYNEFGNFEILGTSAVKSEGIRNGNIVNIEAASSAIRRAIDGVEQNAGVEVSSCFISIGGDQIEGMNATGKVAVSLKGKSQKSISHDDIARVMECATAVNLSLDRQILHVITQEYIVDGIHGIKDPINQLGTCLEAAVHIITASKTMVQNFEQCVNRANYALNGVMLKTLAAQNAVSSNDERDLGSIVIDLGAGTTDFLIVLNDAPVFTGSVPVGGNIVTNDVALMCGIPVAEAEKIKIEAGCAWPDAVDKNASAIIGGIAGRAPAEVSQKYLCEIIEPRFREIFSMVLQKIFEKTDLKELSGNIILTGAGAKIKGIIELVQDVFQTSSVRIGIPDRLGGIEEDYAGPEWATAIGLVLASKDISNALDTKKTKKHSERKTSKNDGAVKRLFRALF